MLNALFFTTVLEALGWDKLVMMTSRITQEICRLIIEVAKCHGREGLHGVCRSDKDYDLV